MRVIREGDDFYKVPFCRCWYAYASTIVKSLHESSVHSSKFSFGFLSRMV